MRSGKLKKFNYSNFLQVKNIPPNLCLQQSATELETVSATFVEEVEVLPSINASGKEIQE